MIDLDPEAIRAHAKRLRISPAVLRKIAARHGVGLRMGRMSGRPTVGNTRLCTETVTAVYAPIMCYPWLSNRDVQACVAFELEVRDAQVRAARRERK